MKRISAIILALIMCLGMALSMTACSGGSSAPAASSGSGSGSAASSAAAGDGGTLVIAIQDEVEGLDVQQIGWTNMVHELIYEPLVVFSEDLSEILPSVAESYTVTDEYIEFVLPADAKFSNGDPLNAEALKASTERYLQVSEYASDLDAVESVEVVNDTTVRYNLTGPAPYMWCSLGSIYNGILDINYLDQVGDEEFNRKPVSIGPFYVEEWEQGSQVVLKRNEYFHTNNPHVKNSGIMNFDTVIVRFIPDEFTRVSELESGDVDIIYDVPTTSLADLEANPDVSVYTYLQPGCSYLNLQTGKGLLADQAVREALTYAVNRDELVDNLDGVVTPLYGFISAAQAGYSAEEEAKLAQKFAYDPEKAKQILKDAGWEDTDGDGIVEKDGTPLSFEMLLPSDRASLKASGSVLQSQFKAIGVDAQIREYEAAYIKQLMKDDVFDMGSRNFEWADADILFYVFTKDSGYPWDVPEVTDALV
ncbi:MAG: hypothetical protein IIY88_02830, partial [Eubacterium sp.]|nr:hypothetical protein [Eubacterium sp.]